MEIPLHVIFSSVFLLSYKVLPVENAYSCYNGFYTEFCVSRQTCCGSYGYRYCCDTIDGGVIAGIVIGSLVGIAILIGLIVLCCIIMNKNRGQAGRVVYPGNHGGGVTVVNSTQQSGMHGAAGPPSSYGLYGGQGINPSYPPSYPPPGNHQYPPPGYT